MPTALQYCTCETFLSGSSYRVLLHDGVRACASLGVRFESVIYQIELEDLADVAMIHDL